jgi:hypothetical protein
MDVTSLERLTLFNRGVNSVGDYNEIQILFPNVTQLSLEINLFETWEKMFKLSDQLPNLSVLDLNFNSFYFKREQVQFLNDFNTLTQNSGKCVHSN